MTTARARFWTAALLLIGLWLGALLWRGSGHASDAGLLLAFYAGGDREAAEAMRAFTELGAWTVLVPLTILFALYLAFRRRRRAALLLITVFGGRMLVELQKLIFAEPRPNIVRHLASETSMGFPSAHAANSAITFLAIALLVPASRRWRGVSIAAAAILAVLIGLSRIVLGVHWPSDVVGGWAFGLLWILVCLRLASARPDAETSVPAR